MRAHDMSEHWRLINVSGGHIRGTFWVDVEPDRQGRTLIRAVDVTVWHEDRKWGRVLTHGDLTAWVKGDEVDLSLRSVNPVARDDVGEHLEAMHDVLRAVAGVVKGGDPE